VTTLPRREWWRPQATLAAAIPATTPAHADAVAPDSPIPFWALMAFTFMMLLAPHNYFPVLGPLRLAFLAAGVAIGSYVYDRLRRGQAAHDSVPEIRLLGYLLGWALVTLPLGSWPGGSGRRARRHVLEDPGDFPADRQHREHRRRSG